MAWDTRSNNGDLTDDEHSHLCLNEFFGCEFVGKIYE